MRNLYTAIRTQTRPTNLNSLSLVIICQPPLASCGHTLGGNSGTSGWPALSEGQLKDVAHGWSATLVQDGRALLPV